MFRIAVIFAATAWGADLRVADAIQHENRTLLRSLIAQKADLNAATVDGTTALHWAVEYDDAEAVGILAKAGAKIDAVACNEATAPGECTKRWRINTQRCAM